MNIVVLLFFTNFPFLCNEWSLVSELIENQYDFIIVGGGSAGSVVASRLSENPNIKVLLLEAGDCQPFASEIPALSIKLVNTDYDWNYKVTPNHNTFLAYTNHQPIYPRGKVLGGSSSTNALIYLRGSKNDYDYWAKMGNIGWSYNEVLPYFLRSEGMTIESFAIDAMYHNTSGPLTISHSSVHSQLMSSFLKAGEEAGYSVRDLNADKQTGFMRFPFTMRNGARCSTAKAFLVPAQFRPNLKILCKSTVTKILFGSNKEAVGVAFTKDDVEFIVNASKEVILSAGAIASPQLLMLSGIGPKKQLQQFNIPVVADLSGVGENLQDHVGCLSLFWKVNCTDCAFVENDFYHPLSALEWLFLRSGILTIPFSAEAVGYVNTKYANQSADWPDIQLVLGTTVPINTLSEVIGVSKTVLENYLGSSSSSHLYSVTPFIMRPKSRGTIRLKSNNSMDNPVIDLNFLSHPDDMKLMIAGLKAAIEIGNSSAFMLFGAKFNPMACPGCENHSWLSDDYLECLARQLTFIYFHPVGTCKMGVASDPMAVVDNNLRVYGVRKLRVIDASIMPTIISANTNAPTIMIAEKASDIIKRNYSI
ncbi:hypothetical protein CHUAL_010704 [Chamberlinius hualienensis]